MMNEPKNNVGTIDRTGQQLGNYRLISSLNLDRYSGMYLGEHVQFNTQCIVKVWQLQLKVELVDSFLTQARGLAQLVHPHILQVRDVGVEYLTPFLTMDYVPHVTLQQRSSHGIPKPLSTILPFLQPLAEALQFAHNTVSCTRIFGPEISCWAGTMVFYSAISPSPPCSKVNNSQII